MITDSRPSISRRGPSRLDEQECQYPWHISCINLKSGELPSEDVRNNDHLSSEADLPQFDDVYEDGVGSRQRAVSRTA